MRFRLFAPLRDKVTSSAQSLAPFRSGYQRPSLSILTEPHDELAPFHPITSSAAIRGTDVTEFGSGLPPQSALMPANFTTLAHFSVSLARRRPKLAGGPGSIVPPMSASRAFALGSARIALISMLSRPMTSGGVFLGAMMPKNALASYPGTNWSTVGMSGSASERAVVVTASARSLPARMCSTDDGRL